MTYVSLNLFAPLGFRHNIVFKHLKMLHTFAHYLPQIRIEISGKKGIFTLCLVLCT